MKKSNKCNKKKFVKKDDTKRYNPKFDKEKALTDHDVNDPKWRMYSDLLGNQVAAFPFTSIASRYSHPNAAGGVTWNSSVEATYPALDVIEVNPSLGRSDSETSAVNQAARMLYTRFSSNNMKTTQYAPQDIIMCMCSVGQLIAINAFIRRAFGYLGTANPRNWYYPKAIITAMHINYDDFIKQAGVYLARFNYLSSIASAIAFPSNFDYFKSIDAIFKNVYLDHTTDLSQTYMFVPSTVWELDETTAGGSTLKAVSFYQSEKRMEWYLDEYEKIINILMTSSTLQYLYADVLKYAKNDAVELFVLPTIAPNYALIPEYSEEVLSWVENSIMVGTPKAADAKYGNTEGNNVTCNADKNMVVYTPMFGSAYISTDTHPQEATIFFDPVLNFHVDNPSTDERISATRLVPGLMEVVGYEDFMSSKLPLYTCYLPDWYVVRHHIISFNGEGTYNEIDFGPGWDTTLKPEITVDFILFHRRPRFIFAYGNTANSEGIGGAHFNSILCELDNYTNVDSNVLRQIQEVAILSLFNL